DVLEVVRELLRPRRLVALADLGEAGQARPDDEPLPVRGKLGRQLLEEPRADRSRSDEAHVAAEDVPELRDLVELRGAEPAAERGPLGVRALDELGAEVRAEPALRADPERPELDHREDPAAAADALAAVEDRPPAGDEDADRDQRRQRQGEQEERGGEEDVERAQLDIDEAAARRGACERREAQDERVARAGTGRHDHLADAIPWRRPPSRPSGSGRPVAARPIRSSTGQRSLT